MVSGSGPHCTRVGDLLQETSPLRLPGDPLAVDAPDDDVIHYGVIVVAPAARVPAFDAGLGARFAEEESHALEAKNKSGTKSRVGDRFPERNQCSSVELATYGRPRKRPGNSHDCGARWLGPSRPPTPASHPAPLFLCGEESNEEPSNCPKTRRHPRLHS